TRLDRYTPHHEQAAEHHGNLHTFTHATTRWGSISFADDFHFRFQLDSPRRFRALFDNIDQRQDVLRRRVAFIHDEIAVRVRHHGAADTAALEAEFVDQFARWNRTGILEYAARARGGRLAVPAFPTELPHP